MKDVSCPSFILEYLKDPPVISGSVSQLIRRLGKKRNNLKIQLTKNLQDVLEKKRYLMSESLSENQPWIRWQEANHWVEVNLQQDYPISWASIVQLNKKIIGDDHGGLRQGSFFQGNREFLPLEFMSEALDEFQKKVLFETDVFVKAFELYLGIETIRPFEQGNSPTARLAGDWVLMSAGFLPVTFNSSDQSHMAITLNHPAQDKNKSFERYLQAIQNSYDILLPN